jgi:ferrous iron transport protein A
VRDEIDLQLRKCTMLKKLSELQTGESGIIDSFTNNDIFLKLMEMGCVPGEKVTVDMIAPLGDPISIQVSGYRLSLRLNEAEHIFILQNN